jgi:cation transport regulator ChaC
MAEYIWYFAYGSNLDPDRFSDRVGPWKELKKAALMDYALRFCGDVNAEGGGGAIIQYKPADVVQGAIYKITLAQIQQMDEAEFHREVDSNEVGIRKTITVMADDEAVNAEVYTISDPKTYKKPSEKYLGHILTGLEAVGYPPNVIRRVESIAESEPG